MGKLTELAKEIKDTGFSHPGSSADDEAWDQWTRKMNGLVAQVFNLGRAIEIQDVTRFDLVGTYGMDEISRCWYGVQPEMSIQDKWRTLKVYLKPHPDVSPEDVHKAIQEGIARAIG
jgi:hypothetical protein